MAKKVRSINLTPKNMVKKSILANLLNNIVNKNRFVIDKDMEENLNNLYEFVKTYCSKIIKKDDVYYRARLHTADYEGDRCYIKDRMTGPPAKQAKGGRLNPVGIPYLYLSKLEQTAVSETRPWTDARLTVAKFKLNKDVKVVDTTKSLSSKDVSEKFKWLDWGWANISSSFSVPTHPEDITAYLSTQFLAEYFKAKKFDGIIYKSSMHKDGVNLALFNKKHAKCETVERFKVNSIECKYECYPVKREFKKQ